MKIKVSYKAWLSIGATVALLALIWVVGTALAQEPDGDSPPALLGGGGPNETHAFTYQGRLEDAGQPANGVYDFQVGLYDHPTAGSLLATCTDVRNMSLQDQYVEDGIFHFYLICGTWNGDFFTGGSRWLRIRAKRDDQPTYTDLTATRRRPISPTPYAWSLYPRAIISGPTSTGGDFGDSLLNLQDTRPAWNGGSSTLLVRNHTGTAIRAKAGTTGVYGYGMTGPGVAGKSGGTAGSFISENGYGVYAQTSGTDHWDHGGYFSATHGCGVYAKTANKEGVFGYSINKEGVFGYSNNDNGVYGFSSGTGSGVYGVSSAGYPKAGVYGQNSSGVGVHGSGLWGVVGSKTAGGWYSGFFFDDVYVQGKLTAIGGVDPIILEGFPADPGRVYGRGDVLCLDEASAYVVPCSQANDTRVIGVIGPEVEIEDGEVLVVIMGHQGPEPEIGPLGTSADAAKAAASLPERSVIRVKADASHGPIRRGDLLTSSPTPGYAMKAQPVEIDGIEIHRPGTIIGKAMEPLPRGQGLIGVFVTLQ
jgi:hypothetical protein